MLRDLFLDGEVSSCFCSIIYKQRIRQLTGDMMFSLLKFACGDVIVM